VPVKGGNGQKPNATPEKRKSIETRSVSESPRTKFKTPHRAAQPKGVSKKESMGPARKSLKKKTGGRFKRRITGWRNLLHRGTPARPEVYKNEGSLKKRIEHAGALTAIVDTAERREGKVGHAGKAQQGGKIFPQRPDITLCPTAGKQGGGA